MAQDKPLKTTKERLSKETEPKATQKVEVKIVNDKKIEQPTAAPEQQPSSEHKEPRQREQRYSRGRGGQQGQRQDRKPHDQKRQQNGRYNKDTRSSGGEQREPHHRSSQDLA